MTSEQQDDIQENTDSMEEKLAELLKDESCPECNGTGEINTDIKDSEGNTMRGVGTAKCPVCNPKRSNSDEDTYNND